MAKLRFARPEDASVLLEIYRPYVEETSITFEIAVPSEREFRDRILEISRTCPYLVAQEDGEILGYAYAHPYRSRAAFAWTVETSIYLRRDARRLGLGRQLYTALFQLLRLQGYCTAVATITTPGADSPAFHSRMGFLDAGTLPRAGYKLGAWHGLMHMALPLLDGEPAAPPQPVSCIPPEQIEKILQNS